MQSPTTKSAHPSTAPAAKVEEGGPPSYADAHPQHQAGDGPTDMVTMPPSTYVPTIRLIPIKVICDILGLKKSAVYAMVARGELVPPTKFGTSRRAAARWIESQI